ncbi:unnamed protein product, partial [Amoebophrya sp. A25]|eukprot:GSA25T00010315001.1
MTTYKMASAPQGPRSSSPALHDVEKGDHEHDGESLKMAPSGHLFVANTSITDVFCDAFLCPGYWRDLIPRQQAQLDLLRLQQTSQELHKNHKKELDEEENEENQMDVEEDFNFFTTTLRRVRVPCVGGPISSQWRQKMAELPEDMAKRLVWRVETPPEDKPSSYKNDIRPGPRPLEEVDCWVDI